MLHLGCVEYNTLTNGASAIFAILRAISVLPQPVGPIMRMFLGTISDCNRICLRLKILLLFAIAISPNKPVAKIELSYIITIRQDCLEIPSRVH